MKDRVLDDILYDVSTSTVNTVKSWMTRMNSDGSFRDICRNFSFTCIVYDDATNSNSNAGDHLDRLLSFAECWRGSKNTLSQNTTLLALAVKGLQYWFIKDPVHPNCILF